MDRLFVREVGRRYFRDRQRYMKVYRCADVTETLEFVRRLNQRGHTMVLSTCVADFIYVMPLLPRTYRSLNKRM